MGIIAFQFQHSSQLSIYAVMRLQPSNISYVAYSCNALCIWLFDSSTIRCNTEKNALSFGPHSPAAAVQSVWAQRFYANWNAKENLFEWKWKLNETTGNIMNLIFICCCWRWYSVLAHYQHFHFLKQFRFVFFVVVFIVAVRYYWVCLIQLVNRLFFVCSLVVSGFGCCLFSAESLIVIWFPYTHTRLSRSVLTFFWQWMKFDYEILKMIKSFRTFPWLFHVEWKCEPRNRHARSLHSGSIIRFQNERILWMSVGRCSRRRHRHCGR